MPRQQPPLPKLDLKWAKYQNQRLRRQLKVLKEACEFNPAAVDEELRKLREELSIYRLEEDKFFMEQEILDHQFKQAGLPDRYPEARERVPRGKYGRG